MRAWAALVLAAALAACGPRASSHRGGGEPPAGVEISYLEPMPDHTPPMLRGKLRNDTGRGLRLVEFDLFYGVGGERELDPLVIRDVPAHGFREFDVPLPDLERRPSTWRAEFVRLEWAGAPEAPSPLPSGSPP